jgi:hypothetical protein
MLPGRKKGSKSKRVQFKEERVRCIPPDANCDTSLRDYQPDSEVHSPKTSSAPWNLNDSAYKVNFTRNRTDDVRDKVVVSTVAPVAAAIEWYLQQSRTRGEDSQYPMLL